MANEKELLELIVTGQIIQRAKEMRTTHWQLRQRAIDDGVEPLPEKKDHEFMEEAANELRLNHQAVSRLLGWTT